MPRAYRHQPQWKILNTAEVIQGETFPNLHAIRGTRYRDPQQWYKSIDVLRSFDAEYMVPTHGRPVYGPENVRQVLTSYRDAIQFVHNQTIRFINRGYTPDELVRRIKLPEHLANHPWLGEFYGTVAQSVRQIYNGELGWFQGDPTSLAPIPPIEAASRYLKLMGGRDRVLEEAQKAINDDDFQWAAELTTYIIRIDKKDMEARHLKALAFRQLGFKQMNINWRNWYLTSALELEDSFDISKRYAGYTSPDVIQIFPTENIVESLTNWLAAEKALEEHMVLGFHFPDENLRNAIEIRKGVAEFHAKFPEEVDVIIALRKICLSDIMLGFLDVEKAINSRNISVDGDREDVIRFFNYFDTIGSDPISLTLR